VFQTEIRVVADDLIGILGLVKLEMLILISIIALTIYFDKNQKQATDYVLE